MAGHEQRTEGALVADAQVLGGEQANTLAQGVMSVLQGHGGLEGVVQKFQQRGLGDVVGSWVSTGQNLPVTGEQLQSVLGSQQLSAMLQKVGLPAEQGLGILARLFPALVDKLTPDGRLPEKGSGQLLQTGLEFLRNTLGARS